MPGEERHGTDSGPAVQPSGQKQLQIRPHRNCERLRRGEGALPRPQPGHGGAAHPGRLGEHQPGPALL